MKNRSRDGLAAKGLLHMTITDFMTSCLMRCQNCQRSLKGKDAPCLMYRKHYYKISWLVRGLLRICKHLHTFCATVMNSKCRLRTYFWFLVQFLSRVRVQAKIRYKGISLYRKVSFWKVGGLSLSVPFTFP